MATIEIDFEVFKELTNRRKSEDHTYNNVLRDLLKLPPELTRPTAAKTNGATFKGVFFPEGTQFRATYKSKTYTAKIKGGAWINSDGTPCTSPSEAAVRITKKNWNGWIFWHCQRPGDVSWHLINDLRDPEPPLSSL